MKPIIPQGNVTSTKGNRKAMTYLDIRSGSENEAQIVETIKPRSVNKHEISVDLKG